MMKTWHKVILGIGMLFFLIGYQSIQHKKEFFLETKKETILLTSSAFQDGEYIPSIYSCEGDDIMPPLHWSSIPDNTQSFVLICSDPDAPNGEWVHVVLYDIPPQISSIKKGDDFSKFLVGKTSWGDHKKGYGGPCPPFGVHRYIFTVYALDITTVGLPAGSDKNTVLRALTGHVIGEGVLMGRYQKGNKS